MCLDVTVFFLYRIIYEVMNTKRNKKQQLKAHVKGRTQTKIHVNNSLIRGKLKCQLSLQFQEFHNRKYNQNYIEPNPKVKQGMIR